MQANLLQVASDAKVTPELVQEILSNGNVITYKVINGTSYHAETVDDVASILELYHIRNRYKSARLVLDFGDVSTGQSWGEVYDISGYIGRSGGSIKIPLLLHNSRSIGGGAILDHCIVRILTARGKRVLYQHPTYTPAADR